MCLCVCPVYYIDIEELCLSLHNSEHYAYNNNHMSALDAADNNQNIRRKSQEIEETKVKKKKKKIKIKIKINNPNESAEIE